VGGRASTLPRTGSPRMALQQDGRPSPAALQRGGVEVLAACERHGIAFVPYFPLATGFLGEPGVLTRPAQRLGVAPPAVALAWLLRRSPVIVPIPGTRSLAHLRDNTGATRVAVQLTGEEVRALTAAADEESATLAAMPSEMAAALGRRRTAFAGR
jgi:pyridoxine 4-dehydrogenase